MSVSDSGVLKLHVTLLGWRPSRGKAPQGLLDDLTVVVAGTREMSLTARDCVRRLPLLREARAGVMPRPNPTPPELLPVRILAARLDLLTRVAGRELLGLRNRPSLQLLQPQLLQKPRPKRVEEMRQWKRTPLLQLVALASEPPHLRSQPKKSSS